MKSNKVILSFAVLALSLSACKKYGVAVPDGYDDASKNQATASIDTNMKVIDRSAYNAARIFPGLVDQSEPRVQNQKFTLDLNFEKQTTDNLRISVAPEPQFSTGYYAAPGELIKLVVPAGVNGLTAQIGAHTDNLTGKMPLLRDPIIINRQALYPGVNYLRNLYGGHIYIRASFAIPQPVEFTISGACVSPDFVLGEISDADWVAKVKASKVPWLEFRTKRVIFTMPKDKVMATFDSAEPITNPTAVMTKWDEVFEFDFNGWMGLSDNASDIRDRSPQGAWRGVLDIQLSAGYGHSGFPFVGLNDISWFKTFTSLNTVSTSIGTWGSYHEFGHNCQQGRVWSWSTLGETTNNLFNFKVANRIGADYTKLHNAVTSGFPKAITYASSTATKNFDTDAAINDPFMRMTPFVQIFEKYGYGAMTHLYKQARYAQRLSNNDQDMHDFVYENLSDYTQTDLIPFFEAWGIVVSQQSQNKISAKNYPLLSKQLWTYNPLDKTGGTATIVPTRSIVSISSNQSNEGSPANMLDNNTATYWHSQYSPAPNAAQTYPFTIVLSQGMRFNAKGMYFFPRNSGSQRVKNIEIFTSNDNINYVSRGTTQIPNAFARYEFLFPGGPVTAKYYKIVLKDSWTANNKLAALAEIGVLAQ